MNKNKIIVATFLFFAFTVVAKSLFSQTDSNAKSDLMLKQLPYSDLDSWYYNVCKESSLVGGESKKVFEVGKEGTKKDEKDTSSPWGTTNIHAKMGVDIYNTCVFPEKTDDGYCCKLETILREVHILGLNLKVLVSGALFLGDMEDPVKSVKNPIQKINHGIPFTQKPKAIQFSFKYHSGEKRIKSIYSSDPVEGKDKAELCLLLQKRWEDDNGNVYATRIGGARNFFDETGDFWVKDTTITIKYGDITKEPFYDAKTMGLIPEVSELYVKNSKGKMVPLIETGWDTNNEKPTHMVLYFASSYEGINFIGSPESVLWVDDIRLIY